MSLSAYELYKRLRILADVKQVLQIFTLEETEDFALIRDPTSTK